MTFFKKLAITAMAVGIPSIAYLHQGDSPFNALAASCHDKGGIEQQISAVKIEGLGYRVPANIKTSSIAFSTMANRARDNQIVFAGLDSSLQETARTL